MFKNILIVCIGNICRSPMAEALFKKSVPNKNITFSSAGLGALVGYQAEPYVHEVLLENAGIDCYPHRARQLTMTEISAADLILVMDKAQRREIERQFPSACGKVHLLGKWGDFEIPDPYKKGKVMFQQTFQLVKKGIDEWQKKLWK